MSADNGYIIQVNQAGMCVLQMYFASAENFPDPERSHRLWRFDTLEKAVRFYQSEEVYSEYGLTIDLSNEKKEERKVLDIQQYSRVPFDVEAVQVTSDNIEEVTKWCEGVIHRTGIEGSEDRYIVVPVHMPLNEKQKQAYVGDWVLKSRRGYKVYTNNAFTRSFRVQRQTQISSQLVEESNSSRNVFRNSEADLQELRVAVDPKDAIGGKR